jgi:hypothetical protein
VVDSERGMDQVRFLGPFVSITVTVTVTTVDEIISKAKADSISLSGNLLN